MNDVGGGGSAASRRVSRRSLLRGAGAGAALVATARYEPWLARAATLGAKTARRGPDSLPFPHLPAGEATDTFPFDHIVMIMQENHSFDNYLGMLPKHGQPLADGFTFDRAGNPTNSNPYAGGRVYVEHAPTLCQPTDITQSWNATHEEIDHGHMDGFAIVDQGQMYYYDQKDIPFYYSLASTFTLANRWFCSAPCQTYPNRRFYLCGTAFGLISTELSSVHESPPNGTLVDRLNRYGITWKDYFVDVPATAVIFEIPEQNPGNMAPIAEFFADCKTGSLPSVSWVSSEIGALYAIGGELPSTIPVGNGVDDYVEAQNQDEENPADIQIGESFVSQVVNALIASPAWPRTLIVWLYDEHGGYYDHVPPPAAIAPDSIKPDLAPGDYPGGYNMYGPRVPAVVASPYSRPHSVSHVVCDHTSTLATIEAQWNLPACTYRDANANTLASFLQKKPALLEPPALASPGVLTQSEADCSTADPHLKVHPIPAGALELKWHGRDKKLQGLVVDLHLKSGELKNVRLELRKGKRVFARAVLASLGTKTKKVVLHEPHPRGKLVPTGTYTLVVLAAGKTVLRRTVHVPH